MNANTGIIAIGAVFLALHGTATWCLLLALFGFGKKHLNTGGAMLRYASEAALPFYVLHQTFILTIGYFVIQTRMGVALKFTVIVMSSFAVTLAVYDVIVKRAAPLRFLLGMRPIKK